MGNAIKKFINDINEFFCVAHFYVWADLIISFF